MTLGDLLPYLTGAGGCIVALAVGHFLILTGKYVTGREYDRTVAELTGRCHTLERANDVLTESLRITREQNGQLLGSSQVTTGLLTTLQDLARERSIRAGQPGTGVAQEAG